MGAEATSIALGRGAVRCASARVTLLLVSVIFLVAACGPSASPTPTLTATPTDTRTPGTPTPLSPTPTLTRTPRPTRTPTAAALPAADVTQAATATLTLPPGAPSPTPTLLGLEDAPAPFRIDLPDGWKEQYNQFSLVRADGSKMPVKVAFYSGPTPAHEAVITLLWDYETIYNETWRDGIELAQVVFDPTCEFTLVGSPPQSQTYTVGLHYAEGIPYQVANCQTEPDVVGWLVGLRHAETNYLFYVRVAPPEGAEADFPFIQSIIDTIRFPGEG